MPTCSVVPIEPIIIKEETQMKRTLASILAIALACCMLFALAACDSTPADSGKKKVGISMPTQSLQRWNQDGSNMKTAFESKGYEVDLQYGGENEAPVQVSQVQNMITGGCDVIVIAAIESGSLGTVLQEAASKGIKIIAYDRLIMDTPNVDYYATFDNWMVGTLQGTYIEDQLKLKDGGGPYNIEFFTGDPGDNNIHFFFGGAMEVLQKYLDSGVLVCPSGQTDIMQVATANWDPANAQSRMDNLISSQGYSPSGTKLDAVMCSNDSTAQGVSQALSNAGFTADNFPIITGQDCDIASVKNMIAGKQSMSVFKDTRILAEQVVTMVEAILNGTTVPVNDNDTYDNGVKYMLSYLCPPVFANANNYRALLIDSGYYTEAQISG
jgi:putative multiple sugar transport system substrate-binding protein